MTILLVTEFFPSSPDLIFTGGVEVRTFYTAQALAKKEKVIVLCRKTKKLRKKKKLGNLLIYPCGLPAFNIEASFLSVFERAIFILAAILRGLTLRFDLVEGSNFVTYLPAYFLGFLKKRPVVACYHDVFKKEWIKNFSFLPGFFGSVLESIGLKLPWTKIVAVSKMTREKLKEEGIKEEKIKVIYGGVEFEKLKNLKSKKFERKNIICISRLVKYKRVRDLVIAFSQLVKQNFDLSLLIIGQGPEERELKILVKEKGLSQKVKFLKNLERDKLLKLLKKSYLFCLPSVIEGFGLSTIEAAACQTPYVISDIKVNKEVTHNGKGGFLFKKKDVIDLKEKLKILLEDKDLYQEKQKQGLLLARTYDWSKIAKETRKVYYEAINE